MNFASLPSLNSLRAFTLVSETGSFSAAASALNVTHAAVSQQVRGLEAQLGATLVTRQGRRIALTEDGKTLAKHLHDGFAKIIEGVNAFSQADDRRPLHVTMTPSFAVSWLMPRISDFKHLHPEIELMLNPTVGVVELEPGGIDLAIRFGPGQWDGFDCEPLLLTDYVIVASKELIGDKDITKPEMLLSYPWLQELGSSEVSDWLSTQGLLATDRLNVSHMPGYMILDGIRRGDGISATAEAFVQTDIDDGRLIVLFRGTTPSTGYHLVTRPGVHRAPLKTFTKWLKSQI